MSAMESMSNPKKEKEGYNYKYETLEQLLGIIKPALKEEGMALIQGVRWSDGISSFVLETGVMDKDETHILDTRPFVLCDDAQAEGSWETYKRRYALRTAFGLTGEDDDGAATLDKRPSNGQYKSKPATDKQVGMMMGLVDELSKMRSQPVETVREALSKVIGCDIPDMTSKQASGAIEQLIAWKDKAKAEEPDGLYDEDVNF